MKRIKFLVVMEIKAFYSLLLQLRGFNKWEIRDNSKIHKRLTEIAFELAKEI